MVEIVKNYEMEHQELLLTIEKGQDKGLKRQVDAKVMMEIEEKDVKIVELEQKVSNLLLKNARLQRNLDKKTKEVAALTSIDDDEERAE